MSVKDRTRDVFDWNSTAPSACTVVRQYHVHQKFSQQRSLSGDLDLRTKNIALSLLSSVLGCLVALVIQAVALRSNVWGYYTVADEGVVVETGNFGLWRLCVEVAVSQTVTLTDDCGSVLAQRFNIPAWCGLAGLCGLFSIAMVAICAVVATTQLLQLCRGRQPCCANGRALTNKVIPVILSMLASSMCLIFAHVAMSRVRTAELSYGSGFWLQVVAIVLTVSLLICTVLESLWRPYPSRRNSARGSLTKPLQSFYPVSSKDLQNVGIEETAVSEIRPLETNPYFVDPFSDASRMFRRSLSEGYATTNKIW